MAKTPELPEGVSLYKDKDGSREFYRVRLGSKFLGKGRPAVKKAFPDHTTAVKWIKEKQAELHPHVAEAEAHGLTVSQIAEVRVALARLDGMASLVDAADAWLAHEKPVRDSVTVEDAIQKLYEVKKKRAGEHVKSQAHPLEMKNRLTRFFASHEKRKMSEIAPFFEKLLDVPDSRGNAPSDAQIVKRARYAKILFRFSIARGWTKENPVLTAELPASIGEEVYVLSPSQVAQLLKKAQEACPAMLPALAIKIFTGIRQTELYRLDWSAVGEKQITVTAAHSKTGRRRPITIPATLTEWLKTERKKSGPVFHCEPQRADRSAAWYMTFKPVRAVLKFRDGEWPQNALRHCFGSYHFALHKNENLTSAEMGNSPAVVRANYVTAITDETWCERFWELTPKNIKEAAQEATPTPTSLQPPPPRTRDVDWT